MPKKNIIDKVLEELFHGFVVTEDIAKKYPIVKVGEAVVNINKLKQILREELQKIAEDVIGEEKDNHSVRCNSKIYPGRDCDCPMRYYNEKRKELTTYFKNIGIEIKYEKPQRKLDK